MKNKKQILKRLAVLAVASLSINSMMSCDSELAKSKDAKADTRIIPSDFKAAPPYQMKLSDPLPANIFIELAKKIIRPS